MLPEFDVMYLSHDGEMKCKIHSSDFKFQVTHKKGTGVERKATREVAELSILAIFITQAFYFLNKENSRFHFALVFKNYVPEAAQVHF